MALQLSIPGRNARLDALETAIGASPIMTIRTGPPPADCAAANTGTVLSTITLPADWMAAAAGGSKSKSGVWQDTSADASGTAAHFRIHDAGATVCHMQGTVGMGTGDLQVDNTSFASGQAFSIITFTWQDGNQ